MSNPRPISVLVSILAGLRFPADRWQVLAHVDHFGVDPGTRHLFWSLPERTYPSAGSVLTALGARPTADRPVDRAPDRASELPPSRPERALNRPPGERPGPLGRPAGERPGPLARPPGERPDREEPPPGQADRPDAVAP
jgi:hypothetical protein